MLSVLPCPHGTDETAQSMSEQIRTRILLGALDALSREGITRTEADGIAAGAGVDPGQVLECFASVDEVVAAALEHAVNARVLACRPRLEGVRTMGELVRVGRELHRGEEGPVSLGVLVAGAGGNPLVARVAAVAMRAWSAEVERVLVRVLAGTPVEDFVDVPGLARMVASGLVGVELYAGVDPQGAERALESLEQLGEMVSALHALGPAAQRSVRIRLRHGAVSRGVRHA